MTYHGHTLQSAVDYIGDLCEQHMNTFAANKKQIPSWGPEIDSMVVGYVQGLQDWIVGYVHSLLFTLRIDKYTFLIIDRFTGVSKLNDILVPRAWR